MAVDPGCSVGVSFGARENSISMILIQNFSHDYETLLRKRVENSPLKSPQSPKDSSSEQNRVLPTVSGNEEK